MLFGACGEPAPGGACRRSGRGGWKNGSEVRQGGGRPKPGWIRPHRARNSTRIGADGAVSCSGAGFRGLGRIAPRFSPTSELCAARICPCFCTTPFKTSGSFFRRPRQLHESPLQSWPPARTHNCSESLKLPRPTSRTSEGPALRGQRWGSAPPHDRPGGGRKDGPEVPPCGVDQSLADTLGPGWQAAAADCEAWQHRETFFVRATTARRRDRRLRRTVHRRTHRYRCASLILPSFFCCPA